MRRFTRLTNGFSKKIEMHMLNVALHFAYYNLQDSSDARVTGDGSGLSDHVLVA